MVRPPLHPLVVHILTTTPQQSGDPPVAVPACQLHHILGEALLIFHRYRLIPPREPGMAQHLADSSLRNSQHLSDVLCTLATTRTATAHLRRLMRRPLFVPLVKTWLSGRSPSGWERSMGKWKRNGVVKS